MVDAAYPNLHEDNPVMLGALPFYHIFGTLSGILPFLHPLIETTQVLSSCYTSPTRGACQW